MARKYEIGNAVCDEYGRARGGKPGDQKQITTPDYKGEVRLQKFYVSDKGWIVERLKSAKQAVKAAKLMIKACNNKHIGYNQDDRYGVIREGVKTSVDINCDCSSLVREILREVTKKDIPDFNTENEVKVLDATGLFMPPITYTDKTTLYDGDVLVTKTKGHTAMIVSGLSRENPFTEPKRDVTSVANADAHNCDNYICKGEGIEWVQFELCRVGFQSALDACGGIDGYCAAGTVNCIEQFQRVKGLKVDGICGKNTRKALKKA